MPLTYQKIVFFLLLGMTIGIWWEDKCPTRPTAEEFNNANASIQRSGRCIFYNTGSNKCEMATMLELMADIKRKYNLRTL
uniref:Secreted protein n=1 Tax=Panagrellus redivivus TaxID=6233 RepID=A0A7E4VWA9_PANRE